MKQKIQNYLEKTGYKIVSNKAKMVEARRYEALIGGYEALAKRFILPDLPESSEQRIILISELLGTQVPEALHIIQALNQTRQLEGDVCEFGVAQGATSALICNEILDTKKNAWFFDSFQGLPAPTEKDTLKDDIWGLGSMEAYAGKMSSPMTSIQGRLDRVGFPVDRRRIVPGFIEETIKTSTLPEKVSFAYIDFDFYEPILIAMDFLDGVLVKDGIVIVDDYDWFSTGAKDAVDEFVQKNSARYELHVPDQQVGYFAVVKKKK